MESDLVIMVEECHEVMRECDTSVQCDECGHGLWVAGGGGDTEDPAGGRMVGGGMERVCDGSPGTGEASHRHRIWRWIVPGPGAGTRACSP